MISRPAVLCLFAFAILAPAQLLAQTASNTAPPSLRFDPARNATDDIQAAIAEAKRTHRRILIDVGGDWCSYCLQMDDFFKANKDLLTFRDEHFIVVPVYFDPKDKTTKALATYPRVEGIPHFYILDADGHVLHSQHVVELRESGDYSPAKMNAFLRRWATAATSEPASR